jgi:hypothetical protein
MTIIGVIWLRTEQRKALSGGDNMSLSKYQTLKPKLMKNIFNDEDYANVYKEVEKNRKVPDYVRIVEELGYESVGMFLNNDASNVLWKKIGTELGISIERISVHYARYSLKTGHKPLLMPHYDRALKKGTFSLAIVLDTTFNWDIYVEGEKFIPRTNDGVLFSGSHHIHWRPDVEFKEDDYYDIMVCQVDELTDEDRTLDEKHFEIMDERNGQWCLKWDQLYDIESYNKKMNYNGNNE